MKITLRALARILALAASVCGANTAKAGEIRLTQRPDLAAGVAAFPHLTAGTPFASRINAALDNAEARVVDEARQCRTPDGVVSFKRSIAVTTLGPRFVSFVAKDDWDCGAHPDTAMMPFVYDLTTGLSVDWNRLLPPSLAGTGRTQRGSGNALMRLLSSPGLKRLYVAARERDAGPDCKDALETSNYGFVLWPDARSHSLVVSQNDLPHAVKACGGPIRLSLERLSALHARPELVEALANTNFIGRQGQVE